MSNFSPNQIFFLIVIMTKVFESSEGKICQDIHE